MTVPPTHLSASSGAAPPPSGESVAQRDTSHVDDDAHSEVWDDERLRELLDRMEEEPRGGIHSDDDMEYDLPYPLYDTPPPPPEQEVDASSVAYCDHLRHAARCVTDYSFDDPFAECQLGAVWWSSWPV